MTRREPIAAPVDGCWRRPPEACILRSVKRVLRSLCLALLLGAQLGEGFVPREESCEERQDCCTPQGACEANCLHCLCCASLMSGVTVATTAESLDSPRAPAGVSSTAVPLTPPPTDILHVPKSIS